MARKHAQMPDQMLLFDNEALLAGVDEKQPEQSKLAQTGPEPASIKGREVDETAATFKKLSKKGYSVDEAKALLAGFSLVRYVRQKKEIHRTCRDPLLGWYLCGLYPTFSKAEQILKEQLEVDDTIEAMEDGTVSMRGNSLKRLCSAGFKFYRSEGITPGHGTPRIKISPNWCTWQKFDTGMECQKAWAKLMKTDMKALIG